MINGSDLAFILTVGIICLAFIAVKSITSWRDVQLAKAGKRTSIDESIESDKAFWRSSEASERE